MNLKSDKKYNIKYSSIQGTYWLIFAVVGSFASVFLLDKGYTNSEIGMILALGNLLTVVLQPFISDFCDRTKRISIVGVIGVITALLAVFMASLFAFDSAGFGLTLAYISLMGWMGVIQPLMTSVKFKIEEYGIFVNFGLCRAFGSFTYAILCVILGALVESHGTIMIPITGELSVAALAVSLIIMARSIKKDRGLSVDHTHGGAENVDHTHGGAENVEHTHGGAGNIEHPHGGAENVDHTHGGAENADHPQGGAEHAEHPHGGDEITLMDFLKRHKLFFLLQIGVLGVYFTNQVLNNFMLQIVTNVGGTAKDMGLVFTILALLEIPTMVFFDRLRSRFTCQSMLKVASLFYTLEIFICHMAPSVEVIMAAQVLQLFSFGLFMPSMVHLIDEIMERGEAVKGQGFYIMVTTITSIISAVIGGAVIDVFGVHVLTLLSTLITGAGALMVIFTVDKVKNER